jgi:hypothetical protein
VYLAKIQEGNFFEEVQISGTYDGKPRETTEPSVYNFFKGIADQKAVKQYAESFKSAPDLIEERKKQAEEAQKIVDTIEKIKPTEQAKVDKQTEETGETFLGEAGKIARDFFEEALKGAKTAVDREKYQAYLDKLKVGDVISSIKLSGDGGAKIEGSSIFEFFRDLVNPENVEIQKTILNGSAGEQYKKEVAQAQLFLAALEKQALESAAAA